MATLILIRHAEPEIQGVFLGQLDPPLSRRGEEHARRTLCSIEVAIAYSSPLRRARETAQCIARRELIDMPELIEIDYGDWTGRTWEEIEAGWGELAREKTARWLDVAPPRGETWKAFKVRVESAWRRIRNGPTPAAIVAHQAVNAALASLIDGRNPLTFSQQYGEVISIDYDVD